MSKAFSISIIIVWVIFLLNIDLINNRPEQESLAYYSFTSLVVILNLGVAVVSFLNLINVFTTKRGSIRGLWLLVLFLIPVLGLILYILFGYEKKNRINVVNN